MRMMRRRIMWMRTRLMVCPRLSQSAGASPMWSIILDRPDASGSGANIDVNYRPIGQVRLATGIMEP